ncbi:acyl-CoA 6-desaturase [Drosophila subpulchrella]|uniref:acyl-CoA 6-desaturase n=1 Tax=Drosophila subpulchrella TaxID=1486046 RepID=UPI0018A1B045|nr:acyl-CoA 6-desaturase [Drosophila subpulchrella]
MNDTPVPVAAQDTQQEPRETGTETNQAELNSNRDSRLSEAVVRHYKSLYQILIKVKVIAYKMSSALTNLLQSLRIVPLGHGKSSNQVVVVKERLKVEDLPEISLEEVAQHDSFDDCWVVIYDRVYDVTHFLRDHPGGDDVIMDHAGRDATIAFHGTGHSGDAIELMKDFLIGQLPVRQHIFRTGKNKVLSLGIPE